MIFGGFLEHFDNQIYGGVFEPGSPLADKQGFRTDVIAVLKELKVPVIRWPGGCFVDSYHWQKGVGKSREPYGDFRWGVVEPDTFGTDEFIDLCRRLGAEPYICQNASGYDISKNALDADSAPLQANAMAFAQRNTELEALPRPSFLDMGDCGPSGGLGLCDC